jgi:hypothetical protein
MISSLGDDGGIGSVFVSHKKDGGCFFGRVLLALSLVVGLID